MGSGMKHTFSKFTEDTKLWGAGDTLQGRDAIQGDLVWLKRWAHMNLMKFNKAKCHVRHLGHGNPSHKLREVIESSLVEKGSRVMVDENLMS